MAIGLQRGDALLVIDVQQDFVTGALAVAGAAAILPAVNRYIREFERRGLPVIVSRDWHPAGHASFEASGGPWPPHCLQGQEGARFAAGLDLGPDAMVVSKGTDPARDAYSAFEGTELDFELRRRGIRRLFACGLATDYCVVHTVLDALRLGYVVFLLADAVRAVNVHPGNGLDAMHAMRRAGAVAVAVTDLAVGETVHG